MPKTSASFQIKDCITHNHFQEIMAKVQYFMMSVKWRMHGTTAWLNESINIYLNKYCPGFIIVPCKLHGEGIEYHTICNGNLENGNPIMRLVELMEGNDALTGAPAKKFSDLG